jgi:hypothetical protein
MYDNQKIQAYMQKRIDYLLEAIADASLEISEKQEQGMHSTFHILNKALSQDRKFREDFKIKEFMK